MGVPVDPRNLPPPVPGLPPVSTDFTSHSPPGAQIRGPSEAGDGWTVHRSPTIPPPLPAGFAPAPILPDSRGLPPPLPPSPPHPRTPGLVLDAALAVVLRFARASARGWSALDWRGRLLVACGGFAMLALLALAVGRLSRTPGDEAFDRGMAAQRAGALDLAIANFTEAIRLNPRLARAYSNRGAVYAKRGDYDQAIADCSEAIRLDPKDSLGYLLRGLAQCDRREWDLAIADFRAAVPLAPDDPQNYANLGIAHMGKREFDQAIAEFSEAIRLDPKDAYPYVWRARARSPKGECDEVIADCTEAIRLDPTRADAYAVRSAAYARRGEREKARSDFNRAEELGLGPDWPGRLLN